jgi:hypothetical protein
MTANRKDGFTFALVNDKGRGGKITPAIERSGTHGH